MSDLANPTRQSCSLICKASGRNQAMSPNLFSPVDGFALEKPGGAEGQGGLAGGRPADG